MYLLIRGARVKAMAICTRHQYLHIYKVSGRSGIKKRLDSNLLYFLPCTLIASAIVGYGKVL